MQQQEQQYETSASTSFARETQPTSARSDNNLNNALNNNLTELLNELPQDVSAQIEDYLDHVCAPLIIAQVPFATRREWRGEMQTHLESLTLAHIELGDSPDMAVEQAFAQFGTSQTVSKQWQEEWEQTGQSNAFAPSLQVARQWYGGAFGLTAALLMVSGDLVNRGGRGAHIAALLFLLTPLVVGVGIGRNARYPLKATLFALKRFALPLLLTYVAVFWYMRGMQGTPDWHGIPSGLHAFSDCLRNGIGYGINVGGAVALLQILCWAVIGIPAAAVMRWTHHTLLPRLKRRLAR